MSENQINLSVNDILDKRFRQSFRGYHTDDVDVFIDKIIQDYATFNKEIDRLKYEIDQLKKGYRK